MTRHRLLKLLDSYEAHSESEELTKKRVIDFVREYPDCFDRSLSVGHITGSAWLLSNDQSKALLMHHAKLNRWLQLGGHADGEADVLAVAIKEAQEESGIIAIEPIGDGIFDIDIHLIPARKHEPEHYHYDVRFLLQVTSDAEVVQNEESHELRWIGKDRSQLPTDEHSVVRMFDKWCARDP